MTGVFWVAAVLWIFVFVVTSVNTRLRSESMAAVQWLEYNHSTINNHPDYQVEADNLRNQYIPGVREYYYESVGFTIPLIIIQSINTTTILIDLLEHSSYILYGVTALGNAAVVVAYLELRKRRYAINGLLLGVSTILTAIQIQEAAEREDI